MDEEKKGEEKSSSGLANVIPTAYYDLIARVCPGVAFWIALSFESEVFQNFALSHELSGSSLFLLLLVGYITGIALTGFSWIWDWIGLATLTMVASWRDALGLKPRGEMSAPKQWEQIGTKMDQVARAAAEPGKILVKGLAEVALCENLLTGFMLLAVLGWASKGAWFYSPASHAWAFVAGLVALFLSVVFRQLMFFGRVKVAHSLYCT